MANAERIKNARELLGIEEIDIESLVKKLVGPMIPIGDSCVDEKRLASIVVMSSLVFELAMEIRWVAVQSGRYHQASIKDCNSEAINSIKSLVSELLCDDFLCGHIDLSEYSHLINDKD